MAALDVMKTCLDSIRQISDHIEDATVYLDAGCTEAFQFLGAYPLLLELGARTVCSLENNSSLDTVVDWKSNFSDANKVVVVTSRLLSDSHRYILRCLSTHRTVLHCAIFTSISEIAHSAYIDSPLGPDAFCEYESLLIQDYEELVRKHNAKEQSSPRSPSEKLVMESEGWSPHSWIEEDIPQSDGSGRDSSEVNTMKAEGGSLPGMSVSVYHFPMVLCPLSPTTFVLPSEGTVAEASLSNNHDDSLSPGLPPISSGLPHDGEDTPPGAIFTAHHLYHLAAKMDLKLDIYSLGDLSKTIGKTLMDMSSLYDVGRRKRSAGLLLIDRTLDLITTCCHGDSLVDRIFSSLPRRERKISSSQVGQNKHGPDSLQRAPLDVQIPLGQFIVKEEPVKDETLFAEAFEAFLCGWNSSDSGSKISDLAKLSCITRDKEVKHSEIEMLSGSLVTSEGAQFSEALLYRRTKDGTFLIKKWLEEALRRENISAPVKTRPRFVTAAELHSMVSALTKDQPSLLRNRGIIQHAVASVHALSEPHCSRWDAFIGAEKMLRASATTEMSQNLSAQIRDLVNRSALVRSHEQKKLNKESSRGLLSFRDALLLAITGYILAGENFPSSGSGGPFSWEEEHFLKEAIIDAILEDPDAVNLKFLDGMDKVLEANLNKRKPDDNPKLDSSNQSAVDEFDDDQWGNWGDEDSDHNSEKGYDDVQLKLELHDRVDSLFKFLHKLCGLKRSHIGSKDGPFGLETRFNDDPSEGKGLLYRVLTMVLGKYDVPGLEYHSSTVGRLFKSGFGRFGLGQAKPSLGDQNVILVFIVGGITGHEVVEAQEALSQSGRDDVELILGGTTLLTPDDMLELLLGSSSRF